MSENHNRRHPPEFRAEAVRLATRPGGSVNETARDLGVSSVTLRGWIRETLPPAPRAADAPPLDADERCELSRLRRRVRVLEEEREILKKAAAFFARETDGSMR